MKRKTLYNFNSVQFTFNQCVFNRIQYRTKHNLYNTRLDNSTDNSTDYSVLTTRLTVWQFDWQFSFTIQLTIRTFNFVWRIRTYKFDLKLALQFWLTKIGETIRASIRAATLPWSKAGVSCRGLRWRMLAESDARMGRVTRGKDSFWWHFSVDRFPIMDLSPGPTPATWTAMMTWWNFCLTSLPWRGWWATAGYGLSTRLQCGRPNVE